MNTGFKTEKKLQQERERSRMYKEFMRQICLDRKFMSSLTDEEFCTYESKRTGISYDKIKKVLVKCGYFTNEVKVYRNPLSSINGGITNISFQNVTKLS
jgi:hypothetical protein